MAVLLPIGRRRLRRYARLREIERMDPERSYSDIWLLDMAYEFPWDMQLSGSISFYYSIAPPSIARLLVRTGELTENTAKRMDDTSILMWETFRNGFTGPRGRAAVRQMNRIHRNAVKQVNSGGEQWRITNEEYLFVLATTMVTTLRGVERYGWRPLSDHERTAAFRHFREMGELMGLKDIPDSYDEFVRFHDSFVAAEFAYTPEAAKLWRATRFMIVDVLTGWLPPFLVPAGRAVAEALLPALVGPDLRRAFGLRDPSPVLVRAVDLALRLRAGYVRALLPPRRESAMPDTVPTEQFPDGDYEISEVGPDHSVSRRP